MMPDISELESAVGYVFRKREFIYTALTHISYANERSCVSNQRLEFLGDSVLGLIVSRYLYENFSYMREGDLSKLRASVVCEATLAEMARKINLTSYMRFGVGERQTGGADKASIQADCFESMLAAVFLDSDLATVSEILLDHLDMKNLIERHALTYKKVDYKTALQELVTGQNGTVRYEIYDFTGPDHDKTFYARATALFENKTIEMRGQGRSKKDAEQDAAKQILQHGKLNKV